MARGKLGLFMIFMCFYCANASKILLVPFWNASHFMEHDGVAKILVARGHEVHLLTDQSLTFKTNRYNIITHKSGLSDEFLDTEKQIKLMNHNDPENNLGSFLADLKHLCKAMMSDKDLFPKLEKQKFDLVIVDNFFVKCYFLIPYKLGVPFVSIGSVLTPWDSRLPLIPSVVQPSLSLDFLGLDFCDENDSQGRFVKRACRLLAFVAEQAFFSTIEEDYLREYVDFPSIAEIRQNASLTLYNNIYLLSSPIPKLPHVEYVGGLTTGPAKPLEAELRLWMDRAPDVVVVSFGSRFPSMPLHFLTKFFDAFGRLSSYRFLFRFKKVESNKHVEIPSNVRVMDWLPQSDALGHNNTRLFITHSGNNGQQEALYHGVPMLCFYVTPDQKSNARRVVVKEYGKMLDIETFDAEELVQNVVEIIENPKYAAKIKHASRVFHSDKHPAERAADAIEHVLKYGGEHLRPSEAYKLQWWEFYMLDIFAILYLAAISLLFVAFILLKFLLRLLCRFCIKTNRAGSKSKTD